MKFGPVTKLDKKKTVTQKKKKKDDDVILANCDVIVFSDLWPICSYPEAGFRTHGLTFSFSFYLHFLTFSTYIYLHFLHYLHLAKDDCDLCCFVIKIIK